MGLEKEDQPKVKEGLKECKRLGKYKKQMDTFFKTDGDKGYNDEMLLSISKKIIQNILCYAQEVQELLEWYARFYLGKQIDKCIEDDGYCVALRQSYERTHRPLFRDRCLH